MTPLKDVINAAFEISGGVFVALNALDIWHKKTVAGQTLTSMAFFFSWGAWNLIFYASLDAPFSLAGGIGIMLMNIVLIGLIIRYRESKPSCDANHYS